MNHTVGQLYKYDVGDWYGCDHGYKAVVKLHIIDTDVVGSQFMYVIVTSIEKCCSRSLSVGRDFHTRPKNLIPINIILR